MLKHACNLFNNKTKLEISYHKPNKFVAASTCGANRNITKVPSMKALEHASFPKRP